MSEYEYISGFYISDALGSTLINGVNPLNAWPVCVADGKQVVNCIWKKGTWPTPILGEVTEAIDSLPAATLAGVVAKILGETRAGIADTSQLYEVWKPGMAVKIGQMLVHEVAGLLKLYRVVQAHTTQSDWQPQNVPALFVAAAPAGVIPDWVQPTGAHDAYNIGDKVRFNNKIYESKINANVWSPTVYPAGWKEIAA